MSIEAQSHVKQARQWNQSHRKNLQVLPWQCIEILWYQVWFSTSQISIQSQCFSKLLICIITVHIFYIHIELIFKKFLGQYFHKCKVPMKQLWKGRNFFRKYWMYPQKALLLKLFQNKTVSKNSETKIFFDYEWSQMTS